MADGFEVLGFYPSFSFVGMSAFCPMPECCEDCIIHYAENLFANHMAVIVCPASNNRVESQDQVSRRSLPVGSSDFSDFGQESLNAVL